MRRFRILSLVAALTLAISLPAATSGHVSGYEIVPGAVSCGRDGTEVSVVAEHPAIYDSANYAWWAWGVSGYYTGWTGWVHSGGQYWMWSPTDGGNAMWDYAAGQYTALSAVTFNDSGYADAWYVWNYIYWEDGHTTTFWSANAAVC